MDWITIYIDLGTDRCKHDTNITLIILNKVSNILNPLLSMTENYDWCSVRPKRNITQYWQCNSLCLFSPWQYLIHHFVGFGASFTTRQETFTRFLSNIAKARHCPNHKNRIRLVITNIIQSIQLVQKSFNLLNWKQDKASYLYLLLQ